MKEPEKPAEEAAESADGAEGEAPKEGEQTAAADDTKKLMQIKKKLQKEATPEKK